MKHDHEDYHPTLMAQLTRRSCPQCRGGLQWYCLDEAYDELGDEECNELLALGMTGGATAERDEFEFWRCLACGEVGMLASPNDLADLIGQTAASLSARGIQPGGRRASGAAPGTRGRRHRSR